MNAEKASVRLPLWERKKLVKEKCSPLRVGASLLISMAPVWPTFSAAPTARSARRWHGWPVLRPVGTGGARQRRAALTLGAGLTPGRWHGWPVLRNRVPAAVAAPAPRGGALLMGGGAPPVSRFN